MKKLIPSLLLAAAATVGCATDDALIPPPELEVKEDAELGEVLYLNGLPLLPLTQHQFMSQEIFPSLFVNRTVLPGEENPCPGSKHYLYLNVGPVNQYEQRDYDRRNHYAYYFPDMHQALAERYPTGYAICPSYDPTIQTEQSTAIWRLLKASRRFMVASNVIIDEDDDGNTIVTKLPLNPAYEESEVLLRDCTPLFITLVGDPLYSSGARETWAEYFEFNAGYFENITRDPNGNYGYQPHPNSHIGFTYAMDILIRLDLYRCMGQHYWIAYDNVYSPYFL